MSGLKDVTKTPLAGWLRQSKNKSISKTGWLQEGKWRRQPKSSWNQESVNRWVIREGQPLMVDETINNRQTTGMHWTMRHITLFIASQKARGQKGRNDLTTTQEWLKTRISEPLGCWKKAPSMVDEVVNNRQNWNVIDDVEISSSIVSP